MAFAKATKKKTRLLTAEEIDALVVLQSEDESAWGAPVPVAVKAGVTLDSP